MRGAGHAEKVKRMRVSDKLLEGMVPFYEVRFFRLLRPSVYTEILDGGGIDGIEAVERGLRERQVVGETGVIREGRRMRHYAALSCRVVPQEISGGSLRDRGWMEGEERVTVLDGLSFCHVLRLSRLFS